MLVISNGMLRSGSTVQFNAAARVLECCGPVQRGGFMGGLEQPDVRRKLDAMKAADDWYIIKTHDPPLPASFYDDRVRVLFSYRDVRDIAASIRKKWNYPFDQIIDNIETMIRIEQTMLQLPSVLVQPYGQLFNDLEEAVKEVAVYLAQPIDAGQVKQIATELSVQSASERLSKRARNPLIGLLTKFTGRFAIERGTELHSDHISSTGGKDGDWVNQFSSDEQAALNNQFADWLSSHGFQQGRIEA